MEPKSISDPESTIAVFGARGKTGIELLRYCSSRGIACRAITRDLQHAVSLPFVTWHEGEVTDVDAAATLIEGCSTVYLNTAFAPGMAAIQTNIIRASEKTGIRYVVKLSYGLITDEVLQKVHSETHLQHKQVEAALGDSNLNWTILRATGFMQNWLPEFSASVKKERKIYEATGDGKMAYIDARDIAAVAASLLAANSTVHYKKIFDLTGPAAIDFGTVAAAIGEAIGTTVTYVAETPEETRSRLAAKGYPEWAIAMLLTFADSQRQGKEMYATGAVADLLGRPPHDVFSFARDYRDRFV